MLSSVEIVDNAINNVSDKATFITNNGKTIRILENCTIEAGAIIIADRKDCVLSNCYISSGVRIRNSSVSSVMAYPGSQILETTIITESNDIKTNEECRLQLNEGLTYDEDNFAFSRGGVIKRIEMLYCKENIEIPIGHCMIGIDEYKMIQEKNKGAIRIHKEIDGKYIILSSQYSHSEVYEQFYDPMVFTTHYYREKVDIDKIVVEENEICIDIRNLNKKNVVTSLIEQERIKEIYNKTMQYNKIYFVDRKGGAIIIEK